MDRTGTDPALPIVLPSSVGRPAAQADAPAIQRNVVERARAGDLGAWSLLYQETYDAVFRHVCYLTGDTVVAEDLVQDAYARAMTSISRYDARSSFVSWIRGIALNVVRMYWRRNRIADRVHGDLRDITDASQRTSLGVAEAHLRDERLRALYLVLGTLPENLREAFILRELQGLSTQESAEQLGISPGNAAVRATRARARIREELERMGWLGGDR